MPRVVAVGSTPRRNPFDAAKLGASLAADQRTQGAGALAREKFDASQADKERERETELRLGTLLQNQVPVARTGGTGEAGRGPMTPVEAEAAQEFADTKSKRSPFQRVIQGLSAAQVGELFKKDPGRLLEQIAPDENQRRELQAGLRKVEAEAGKSEATLRKEKREEQDDAQLRQVTVENAELENQHQKAGRDTETARVMALTTSLQRTNLQPSVRANLQSQNAAVTKAIRDRGVQFFGIEVDYDGTPRVGGTVQVLVRKPFGGNQANDTISFPLFSKAEVEQFKALVRDGSIYPAKGGLNAADAQVFGKSLLRAQGLTANDAQARIAKIVEGLEANRQLIVAARSAAPGSPNARGSAALVLTGIMDMFGGSKTSRDRVANFISGGDTEAAITEFRTLARLDKGQLLSSLTGEKDNSNITRVEQRNVDDVGRFIGSITGINQVRAITQMISRTQIGRVARLQMQGRLPRPWDVSTLTARKTLGDALRVQFGLTKRTAVDTVRDIERIQSQMRTVGLGGKK